MLVKEPISDLDRGAWKTSESSIIQHMEYNSTVHAYFPNHSDARGSCKSTTCIHTSLSSLSRPPASWLMVLSEANHGDPRHLAFRILVFIFSFHAATSHFDFPMVSSTPWEKRKMGFGTVDGCLPLSRSYEIGLCSISMHPYKLTEMKGDYLQTLAQNRLLLPQRCVLHFVLKHPEIDFLSKHDLPLTRRESARGCDANVKTVHLLVTDFCKIFRRFWSLC